MDRSIFLIDRCTFLQSARVSGCDVTTHYSLIHSLCLVCNSTIRQQEGTVYIVHLPHNNLLYTGYLEEACTTSPTYITIHSTPVTLGKLVRRLWSSTPPLLLAHSHRNWRLIFSFLLLKIVNKEHTTINSSPVLHIWSTTP